MLKTTQQDTWTLARGTIYHDVYRKRVDDRPVESTADLQQAQMVGAALRFASPQAEDQALRDGIFLLQIPESLDVSFCDLFSRQFYQGPAVAPYGEFRELASDRFQDPLLGYHERNTQIEQFLLERRYWDSVYPPEITHCGLAMTQLARLVLRAVLQFTDIPAQQWSLATGGCTDWTGSAAGSHHLTFNHYRPTLPGIGLPSHKDDGFMTILRTITPGLEVNKNDRWESVLLDPHYFVVNFGLAMEVLTRQSSRPVTAIMHRVRHQTQERFSFGHFSSSFCEPGAEAGIYSFDSHHGLHRVCSSRALIDANDEEIYYGTRVPQGEG